MGEGVLCGGCNEFGIIFVSGDFLTGHGIMGRATSSCKRIRSSGQKAPYN